MTWSTRAEEGLQEPARRPRPAKTTDVENRLTEARGLLATAQSALDGDRPRAEDQRNQRLHQIQLEIDDCDALQGMQAAAEAPWDGRIGFREPSPSSPPADNGPLLVMYHPGNLVVTIRLDDDQAAPANEDLAVEMAAITAPHDLDGMDRPETFFPGTLVGRSAAANGFVELRATVAPPERLVRQVAMGGTVPVKARLRRALTSMFSFRLAVGFGAIAFLLTVARAWRRRRGRQADTDGEASRLPMVVPQTVGLTAYPARRRPITVELLEDAPGHAALPATRARPAINELPDAPQARLMPGPPLAALTGDEPVDLNDPIYLTGLGARFRYGIEAGELHPPLVYEVGGALRQGGYHAAALVVAGFGGTIAKQAVVRAAFDLLDHSAPDADIGEAARDCAEFLLVIRIIGSDRLERHDRQSCAAWSRLGRARDGAAQRRVRGARRRCCSARSPRHRCQPCRTPRSGRARGLSPVVALHLLGLALVRATSRSSCHRSSRSRRWAPRPIATTACAPWWSRSDLFASSFLVFTLVSLLRHAALMGMAFVGASRAARRVFPDRTDWPTVTILVPAFNEALRIEKAIEAIIALDYPDLVAIVVDDGSTDDTFARAQRYAGRRGGKTIRVVKKPNGGKWSALNLAFHEATTEIVVCVDADSQLDVDALKLLARHFEDPKLGGVAGQVDVRNKVNIVTRLQALEYMEMNGLARQAQSTFGTVLVAPGPLAMFRRAALADVWSRWGKAQTLPIVTPTARIYGPWEDDTFAEDADLTLAVLLTGRAMTYEPRAISHTSVPEYTFPLLNQRYRWTRGNLQAALKAWRRSRSAPDAPRSLSIWLGMLLFDTIVWPAVNLYGVLAFALMVAVFGLKGPLLFWFLALTAVDLNAAAFCVRLEGAKLRLLALAPLSRIYFNVILDVSKFFALYDEQRGKRMSWS